MISNFFKHYTLIYFINLKTPADYYSFACLYFSVCGRPKLGQPSQEIPQIDHGKIIGGHNAKKGAYPWQVSQIQIHFYSSDRFTKRFYS